MNYINKTILSFVVITLLFIPIFAKAGNISSTNNMAWGNTLGWVNFSTDNGNVTVYDTNIIGYIWSANNGWINLSPDKSGVKNDGNGNLSGMAWSDKLGWIDFSGVNINPNTGVFSGNTVNAANVGAINFSCDHCSVITTWRKISTSTEGSITNNNTQTHSSGSRSIYYNNEPASVIDAIASIPSVIYDKIVPDFIKPNKKVEKPFNAEEYVRNSFPLVMKGKWNIFPHKYSDIFVLAPLPREINNLVIKFPELKAILSNVGVNKITDLEKLRNSNINLPKISEAKDLPAEIVMAGDTLINLSSTIQISNKGELIQKIKAIANKPLKLSIRPMAKADSVIGYLTFISKKADIEAEISTNSSFALALMAIMPKQVNDISIDKIEKKLIVSTFEYTDTDGDGIYTADINAPAVDGNYEVITLIKYSSPELGTKEFRLLTVIDPEGYVYEKIGNQEARIPNVKVSIFRNSDLWDSKKYNQDNPQITDKTGKYSFLVPEGEYFIIAEAKGYKPYKGDTFVVREGQGVHFNIELSRDNSIIWNIIDWKIIIIIILIIISIYHLIEERRIYKQLAKDN